MEQNMLCLGYLHDSKPILSFCLNSSCVISSLCCTVCLKERHQKHQEDIKNKDYVTELIQNFINEQTYIENELNGLNLNQEEVLKQILDFIGQIKISLTTSLQLIKDNKFEETNGGIIDIKYWYKYFHDNNNLKELFTILKDSNEQQKGLKAFKIKLDELQAQIFNCKGLQLMEFQKWREAQECFNFVIQINDHNLEAICEISRCLTYQQKYKEAQIFIEQGLSINQNYGYLYSVKAFMLLNMQQNDEGLAFIEKSIQINPMSSYAWNVKGSLLLNQGQKDESFYCFKQAIEIDPENTFPQINLSLFLNQQDQFDEANQLIDQAIKIGKNSVMCFLFKKNVLIREKKFDEALKILDKVLILNPSHLNSLYDKAHILENQNNLDQALQIYFKAYDINPQDEKIAIQIASVLAKQDKGDEATQILQKIIPQETLQCIALFQEGNFQGAIQVAQNNQHLDQLSNLINNCNLAIALAANGQNDEAKVLINNLIYKEQHPIVKFYKSIILLINQEYEEELNLLDDLINEVPTVEFFQIMKCMCLMNQQKNEEAHKSLEYLLNKQKNSMSFILKGQLLLRENKINEAQQQLLKAIEIDSTLANLIQTEGDQLKNIEGEDLAKQLLEKLLMKMTTNVGLWLKYV